MPRVTLSTVDYVVTQTICLTQSSIAAIE